MEYTLVRSKRRTASIYVRESGVEVKAPLKMSKQAIDEFVISKERWILKSLEEMNERAAQRSQFALGYGSMVLYLGREYPIAGWERKGTGFDGQRFLIPSKKQPEQIRSSCVELYRKLAKLYLQERTIAVAERMGIVAPVIKISGAKTRWGSYNVRKTTRSKSINFTWRLILAEQDAIEYVIVHELAHMMEMNHSKRFWDIVACELPDYKVRMGKLRILQDRIYYEQW